MTKNKSFKAKQYCDEILSTCLGI